MPEILWTKDGKPVTLSNRIQQLNNGSLVIKNSIKSPLPNNWIWLRSMIVFYLQVHMAYPTMHYFGIPMHAQSMRPYIVSTRWFLEFCPKLYCWNVVNTPTLISTGVIAIMCLLKLDHCRKRDTTICFKCLQPQPTALSNNSRCMPANYLLLELLTMLLVVHFKLNGHVNAYYWRSLGYSVNGSILAFWLFLGIMFPDCIAGTL